MLACPPIGRAVQIWYGPRLRHFYQLMHVNPDEWLVIRGTIERAIALITERKAQQEAS